MNEIKAKKINFLIEREVIKGIEEKFLVEKFFKISPETLFWNGEKQFFKNISENFQVKNMFQDYFKEILSEHFGNLMFEGFSYRKSGNRIRKIELGFDGSRIDFSSLNIQYRMLFILSSLFFLNGDRYYIEHPESFFYERKTVSEFLNILISLTFIGFSFVLNTNSELLLNEMLIKIKNGEIEKENVGFIFMKEEGTVTLTYDNEEDFEKISEINIQKKEMKDIKKIKKNGN